MRDTLIKLLGGHTDRDLATLRKMFATESHAAIKAAIEDASVAVMVCGDNVLIDRAEFTGNLYIAPGCQYVTLYGNF